MSAKIKWGVLGYARIAKDNVIPAIIDSSNAEFYAIASRDEEKIKDCGKIFSFKKSYVGYHELLGDPDIQAVYIPLPNHLHKEWVINAVRKGKHVLCEKPISLNAEECMEMIQESKNNQVKLMEAFMYRFTLQTKMILELIKSGIIGELKAIHSSFCFNLNRQNDIRMNPAMGGGSLYDVGCYPLNLIGLILNDSPVKISAQCVKQNKVDIHFAAVLKYKKGVICTMESGFDSFKSTFTIINGSKGTIRIPQSFSDSESTITLISEEGAREISVPECKRYQLEIEDFSDAIIHNREPLISLEESYRNMNIMDRLLEAIA